jgi:hypothetical protein
MLLIRMDRRTRLVFISRINRRVMTVVSVVQQLRAECVSVVCINTESIQPAVGCCRFSSILSRLLTSVELHFIVYNYIVFPCSDIEKD